jgi:hypothetical protein
VRVEEQLVGTETAGVQFEDGNAATRLELLGIGGDHEVRSWAVAG